MQKYDFQVKKPYKTFILNWQKTIEWRLNKWKFKKTKIWDILYFETWEEFLITDKREYKTFFEMLKTEWIKKVVPDVNTIDEAVNIYYKFYTKQQEIEFWVIALEIEKV